MVKNCYSGGCMSVLYSQNGVIAKVTETVDWFSTSPNFEMQFLSLPIVYGTVNNYPSNVYNGVFQTSNLNLANANTVEMNIKYKILGWNYDYMSYGGQFYTNSSDYRRGVEIAIEPNRLLVSYFKNGYNADRVNLCDSTAFAFAIQDIIEFKYIVNQQESTVYARIVQNGNVILDTTYSNVTGLNFSDNESFNFLGVRFSAPNHYGAPAQLYLDSTNFKKNGSVIWGSTKV